MLNDLYFDVPYWRVHYPAVDTGARVPVSRNLLPSAAAVLDGTGDGEVVPAVSRAQSPGRWSASQLARSWTFAP
jgi:hypothetical protein